MTDSNSGIRPFLCDSIDKALLRNEWEKWLRSLRLYLDSENIVDSVKKKKKLLHLGGPQLQEVAFNIPGAIETFNPEENNDVFQTLIDKLTGYFSPQRNSTFERHLFRNMKPLEGEGLNKFILRVRQQAAKCTFGETAQQALEINLKDKLIDNWANSELKKRLLEKEYSLDESIEICRIHDQITIQSEEMQRTEPSTSGTYASGQHVNRIVSRRKRTIDGCNRCGRRFHQPGDERCPARKVKCHSCGRLGHFASKCRTSGNAAPLNDPRTKSYAPQAKRGKHSNLHHISIDDPNNDEDSEVSDFGCFRITEKESKYHQNRPEFNEDNDELIQCSIGGVAITRLIDSGTRANVISGQDWRKLRQQNAVIWDVSTNVENMLTPYGSQQSLNSKCHFTAGIRFNNSEEIIAPFYVIEEGKISLLGKRAAIRLGVLKLGVNAVEESREQFPKMKGVKVRLTIDPTVKPVRQPVRRIPIAVEKQVEEKLNETLQRDIIERVEGPSAWISPIVVLLFVCCLICIDMRRANEAIKRENYPLPTFDSFITKLKTAKFFSRLDLTNAYHQLELEESSRAITTFITHKGMFRYKRLMFGVNSAPEIFQRIFESLLASCENCLNYLDDIIVFGGSEKQHDTCLKKVLNTLETSNVLLNKDKCIFKATEIKFLGHKLSSKGIDADDAKIKAIREFRAPTTKEEIRSFLGLVTYLGKFIPDLSNVTEPLRRLTKKDIQFNWTAEHQQNFDKLKHSLTKPPTLGYFDQTRATRVVADASPVALGSVLIQFQEDGTPTVISFASRSLSTVERRYSQTEKESLALVWAVERFYYYLAGLTFELVTDHKPLEAIFNPTSKPPARIERWLLRLQAFRFKVKYEAGKSNIADSVSRLCRLTDTKSYDSDSEVHVHSIIERARPKAISVSEIVKASIEDHLLARTVAKVNEESWQTSDNSPYYPFRSEFTTLGPVLLRGNKIVMPESLRERTLQLAHEGHPGQTVMKRRLRAKTWWPLIDRHAEEAVKACRYCLVVSIPTKPVPMNRHEFPTAPWRVLAIDLMGPLPSQEQVLVVIDYYSRYQDIKFLRSTTATIIINHLTELFAKLGIPVSIRADNGPQFAGVEFKKFCEDNNIRLIRTTTPYWPQANGEVENMNKALLKRLQISHTKADRDYKVALHDFILMYNTTPHGTTGKSPSELMFGRNIRDKIPSISDFTIEHGDEEARDRYTMNKQKGKEKEDRTRKADHHEIAPGDKVLVKNVIRHNKLTPNFGNAEYTVIQRSGNELLLQGEDRQLRRNISHVKKLPTCTNDSLVTATTTAVSSPSTKGTGFPSDSCDISDLQLPNESAPTSDPKVQPLRLERKEGMWKPKTDIGESNH